MTVEQVEQVEYVSAKFIGAINDMAVSELPLRERIARAREAFAPAALHVAALRKDERAEFEAILSESARLDELDDSQVRQLARRIVDLGVSIRPQFD
jgi:hypothetical protein